MTKIDIKQVQNKISIQIICSETLNIATRSKTFVYSTKSLLLIEMSKKIKFENGNKPS